MGTVVRELDPETQTPMFEIATWCTTVSASSWRPAVPAVWATRTL